MMTKSPVSTWGAKIGLCLPRSRRATSVESRPSTRPSASMTCQARWMSVDFGENVRTESLSCLGRAGPTGQDTGGPVAAASARPGARSGGGRLLGAGCVTVGLVGTFAAPLLVQLAAAHLNQPQAG